MADAEVKTADLPEEERIAIRDALRVWQAEGVENPLIPMDVDVDGDGIVDSWGLDADGEVVVVPSRPLEETVFRSDGDGLVEGR